MFEHMFKILYYILIMDKTEDVRNLCRCAAMDFARIYPFAGSAGEVLRKPVCGQDNFL